MPQPAVPAPVPTRRVRPPRALVAVCALVASSAAAVGTLSLSGPGRAAGAAEWVTPPEPPLAAVSPTPVAHGAGVLPRTAPLDARRWRAIVIHESGTPAGDMASIERRHWEAGRAGLGYHFVVGNGQGMEDGLVGIGYRWDRQLPGAHAPAAWRASARDGTLDGTGLNEAAIAICVIGNIDRRPLSDRQRRETQRLVRALQVECAIPDSAVHFARDLVRAAGGRPAQGPSNR